MEFASRRLLFPHERDVHGDFRQAGHFCKPEDEPRKALTVAIQLPTMKMTGKDDIEGRGRLF
jgi:hypothetical protein